MLGGSSSINGMLYVRADRSSYDDWAADGAPGWGYENLLEAFYVLSGELEILDGGHTFIAGPGDFVFIPRGIRHRFKNTGVHGARLLFLFTPGGEQGVFTHGDEARPGHSPPPWGVERFMTPEILRFNEEFGIEILPE